MTFLAAPLCSAGEAVIERVTGAWVGAPWRVEWWFGNGEGAEG